MAVRGSGIGMGFTGGLGATGSVGPSNTGLRSAAPGQLYGPRVRSSMGNLGVHHYLWILVGIEMLILVMLRVVVFKQYHGG